MTKAEIDAVLLRLSRALDRRGGLWLDHLPFLRAELDREGGSLPVKQILEACQAEARAEHAGRFVNWFTLAIVVDPVASMRQARRTGFLRSSRYGFNDRLPSLLVKHLLARAADLGLSAYVAYLSSVESLLGAGRAAKDHFDKLSRELRRQKWTALRGCLMTIEYLFLRETYYDVEWPLDFDLGGQSNEHLAEGLSFLCAIFEKQVGLSEWNTGLWDVTRIREGHYLEMLKKAARLRQFQETEILVDHFGFSCRKEGGRWSLHAPTAEFEKAMRMGYMHQESRSRRYRAMVDDVGVISIKDAGARLHAISAGKGLISVVDFPFRRVRIEVESAPP